MKLISCILNSEVIINSKKTDLYVVRIDYTQ